MPSFLPALIVALDVVIAVAASVHVVLNKSDTRGATSWVGLIWLVPILGAVLYVLLGINRIERSARVRRPAAEEAGKRAGARAWLPVDVDRELGDEHMRLVDLAHVVDKVTQRPLLGGNHVELLVDGDEAYPAMLAAIRAARQSISLVSYIFEAGGVGGEFVEALAHAARHGVEVRVLIDDVGTRYSRPRIHRALRKRGVRVATFQPAFLPRSFAHINLRNHCKILVVDGRVGFTGGMNIRQGCVLASNPKQPTRDVHFRVRGPVVNQLQESFARDWAFTTREELGGIAWFPELESQGAALARGIVDGPDQHIDRQHWVLLAALGAARRSIRIMTPYFLPDRVLTQALHLAAHRGVEVDIVVPEVGNLAVVRWAMWGHHRQVLQHGVRLWLSPPPFDHSKLIVVDGDWSSVGSSNWDPRSLRLNFEFNIECYDEELGASLEAHVQARLRDARLLTIEELDRRSLFQRIRDGSARLAKPYL
ncbi:MAG: cardiolipin synthase [Kofleriaceae bacterium]